jgi:hypothetical protein
MEFQVDCFADNDDANAFMRQSLRTAGSTGFAVPAG